MLIETGVLGAGLILGFLGYVARAFWRGIGKDALTAGILAGVAASLVHATVDFNWQIQANAAGVDDALMLDARGFVAETNATHVFVAIDDILATPRTVACPEGITRGVVLELCDEFHVPHEVRDISLSEVYRSEEMFCTGTMGELAPVVEVDGRTIGTGATGPRTARLIQWFADRTAREGTPVI